MKKLNEIELTYMGKTFTLEDFYNYLNNIKPNDISKIGGLTYAKKLMIKQQKTQHFTLNI